MILTKTKFNAILKTLDEAKTADEVLTELDKIGHNENCPNEVLQDQPMTYS
jgi:hypothetical protein